MPESSDRLLELIAATTLESIILQEARARRAASDDEPESGEIALRIDNPSDQNGDSPRSFGLGLRVTLRSPNGAAVVEPIARYNVAATYVAALDEDVLLEFANTLGITMLVPYARQALSDITQRVFGAAELMPMFDPGELNFEKLAPGTDV